MLFVKTSGRRMLLAVLASAVLGTAAGAAECITSQLDAVIRKIGIAPDSPRYRGIIRQIAESVGKNKDLSEEAKVEAFQHLKAKLSRAPDPTPLSKIEPPPKQTPPADRYAPVKARALPASDGPLPWSQIEKVVKFEQQKQVIGFGREAEAEAVSRQALDLMQQTPEGREVLRQLVEEYGRLGKTIHVRAKSFPGSYIITRRGGEVIYGTRGSADIIGQRYNFNERYLDMKDRDSAIKDLAAIMAHEFRHFVTRAQVKRLSPEEELTFALSFIDEQRARETGYLVAVRLNSGTHSHEMEAAAQLVLSPEGYWSRLKEISSYATKLDMDELQDPVTAYRLRIQTLEEIKNECLDLGRSPHELREYEEAIETVRGLLDGFTKGSGYFLNKMKGAVHSAAHQLLLADQERDQKALQDLLRSKFLQREKK